MLCIAAALSMPLVARAQTQPASFLPTTAGIWTAMSQGEEFGDVAASSGGQIAFVLTAAPRHFSIRLNKATWNVPVGLAVPLTVEFADGDTFRLEGVGSRSTIEASIRDSDVASWTHNFTARGWMTVNFPQGRESSWVVPLAGTTKTVEAMASAVGAANILGLPRPWAGDTAVGSNQPVTLPPPVNLAPNQAPAAMQRPQPEGSIVATPQFSQSEIPVQAETSGFSRPQIGGETRLSSIVEQYAASYAAAGNDMQKGGLRPERGRQICAAFPDRKAVNWAGKISALTSNNDGNGVLSISLSDKVTVSTVNNSLSEIIYPSLIKYGSSLYNYLSRLKVGDSVKFSGQFYPNEIDCIEEESLTVRGAMSSPEFVIHFSDVELSRP